MIGRIVGDRKKCCLRASNLLQPDEIARRHVNPIVVVDVKSDGEHCIGGSAGIGCLNQLNIAVSACEVIGTVRANTAVTGAVDILHQRAYLETVVGFRQRQTGVGEATKQVRAPLGCVERVIVEII